MTERYSGWTDRPTWALNLWWANDEGMYEQLRDVILNTLHEDEDEDGVTGDTENAVDVAASFLEEDFREREAAIEDGMMRDMIPDPNFREVARSWVDEEVLQMRRSDLEAAGHSAESC